MLTYSHEAQASNSNVSRPHVCRFISWIIELKGRQQRGKDGLIGAVVCLGRGHNVRCRILGYKE